MGKRLRKAELLQDIRVERSRLDALLEQLTPRLMTQRGATLAGWSVKDILRHLIGWQQMNLDWYTAGLRREMPEMPASGLTWKDIRKLNDQIYRKHHRRSLKAVLADYNTFHQEMLGLIEEVSSVLFKFRQCWRAVATHFARASIQIRRPSGRCKHCIVS